MALELKISLVSIFLFIFLSNVHAQLGNPLFLTPYIRNGQISEGQELSRVHNVTGNGSSEFPSFSGFITVNETYDTNMFFWFFPAQNNDPNAPVIIWCEGGPGLSGIYPLFNDNGPYKLELGDTGLKVLHREFTWNSNKSIIYIDNPVGTGFSFTKNQDGHSKSELDASHTYNFLEQFFTLFPEYQKNDFYVGGHSFGGKFGPALALEIHIRNQEMKVPVKINLKGLILEALFVNPTIQLNYGNFLSNLGVLDKFDKAYVDIQMSRLNQYLKEGRSAEAFQIWRQTISNEDSYLLTRTGLNPEFTGNYLLGNDPAPEHTSYFAFFVEQEFIRNAIHVGNVTYIPFVPNMASVYTDWGLLSTSAFLEELLQDGTYRILVYTRLLDVIIYHNGVKAVLDALEWDGAQEFRNARAMPFYSVYASGSQGFMTKAQNLTYLLIRNAGHDVTLDKPHLTFDTVDRFVQNSLS